jgi:hypothetical protein
MKELKPIKKSYRSANLEKLQLINYYNNIYLLINIKNIFNIQIVKYLTLNRENNILLTNKPSIYLENNLINQKIKIDNNTFLNIYLLNKIDHLDIFKYKINTIVFDDITFDDILNKLFNQIQFSYITNCKQIKQIKINDPINELNDILSNMVL